MHRRDVEGVAHLVEPGDLAILRQQRRDVEPREGEQISQRIFILDAGHATHPNTAPRGDTSLVGCRERVIEFLEKCRLFFRRRPLLVGRWHFASCDSIVNPHESCVRGRVIEIA